MFSGSSAPLPGALRSLQSCGPGLQACGGGGLGVEVPGGSQQRGQDCLLQVPAACSPRLCTLWVLLARGSCSAQRPLTARAPVPLPLPAPRCIWPEISSSPGASPRQCFSDPLDSWSFICSSYIIWDLNYYAPEILSERDRGFHGFWRGDGKGGSGPTQKPHRSPDCPEPVGCRGG